MKKILASFLTLFILLFCTSCNNINYEERKNIQEIENAARSYLNPFFDKVTVENVSSSENVYFVLCNVSSSGKFFDISAKIELKYTKNNKNLKLIDGVNYKEKKFKFHATRGEYCYGKGYWTELFLIQKISEYSIQIRCYGYDYDCNACYYDTASYSLLYLKDQHCFEFTYGSRYIPYRLYPDHIEVGTNKPNEDGSRYWSFEKTDPRSTNSFWWFDEALEIAKSRN